MSTTAVPQGAIRSTIPARLDRLSWSPFHTRMTDVGASTTEASLALTAFWGMVTLGRLLFAAVQRVFPAKLTYHVLPFVLAVAFVLIALLPDDEPVLGILAFGLAGLGCSALLPLTISFGQSELTAVSAAAAGGIIAFYQLGYGIAAFGTGPLLDSGTELSTVYAIAAAVAVAMVSSTDFANSLTVDNASSAHYTLKVMTVVALLVTPVIIVYQGWTYHVFRHRLGGGEVRAPDVQVQQTAEPGP